MNTITNVCNTCYMWATFDDHGITLPDSQRRVWFKRIDVITKHDGLRCNHCGQVISRKAAYFTIER